MIDTHERAKRFKDARTVHNVHGNQTIKDVSDATKVQPSMISDLESYSIDRPVRYQKILALANHYGVNVAWLIGQPDSSPSLNPDFQNVTRATGLSPKAIEQIKSIKHNSALIDCLNTILESDNIREIVTNVLAAKTINEHNKQPSEMADLIERLNRAGLIGGMSSSNTRMSNRELIDFYMYRAWKDTKDLYESIVKGENENGTR